MIRKLGIIIASHVEVNVRIVRYTYEIRTSLPKHVHIAADTHVLEFNRPWFTFWTVTDQVNGSLARLLEEFVDCFALD